MKLNNNNRNNDSRRAGPASVGAATHPEFEGPDELYPTAAPSGSASAEPTSFQNDTLSEEKTEMTTDSFTALLNRNLSFVDQFEAGDLTIRPRMSTIILTCIDARVDPAHLFELGLGDAVVIRNAGGRITRAVMRDLGILSVLAANMPGPGPMQPELVVVHHTDCGLCRLANPIMQKQVAQRLSLSIDEVAAMAITDPDKSVQDDIERLRQTPGTPDQLIVSGFVYDVKNGTINQVVPPAPLRAPQPESVDHQ